MSGGFNNPIIGGGGNLVYPAIQSPDFSITGQTGWAIMKNGNAYFFNIIAKGTITASVFIGTDFEINAAGAFFYNGAPANGNLFCSIASTAGADGFSNPYGSGVNVGNQGGAHLAISTAGDLLIANAANLPVAFFYHGDGSLRFYNPAGIAAGQLATVVSPVAGADSAGNPYPPGLTAINNANNTQINMNAAFLNFIDSVHAAQSPAQIGLTSLANTDDSLLLTGPASGLTDVVPFLILQRAASPGPALVFVSNAILLAKCSALDPALVNTPETWHTIPLASGWSTVANQPVPSYRLLADGTVEITGSATHASFAAATALTASGALPAAYRPATNQFVSGCLGSDAAIEITPAGLINAEPPAATTSCRFNGTYPVNL